MAEVNPRLGEGSWSIRNGNEQALHPDGTVPKTAR